MLLNVTCKQTKYHLLLCGLANDTRICRTLLPQHKNVPLLPIITSASRDVIMARKSDNGVEYTDRGH